MKLLIDKLIVLLLCMTVFFKAEITAPLISGMLTALTSAFLCQVMWKRQAPRLTIELVFGFVSAVFPAASFFSALPLYESVRSRDKVGTAVIAAGALRGFFIYGEEYIVPFSACVIAVYLSLSSAALIRQQKELNKSRDSSVELERLLKRRNRELHENLEYELRINTLNERNRIAREIHDNVGHILSRTLLQTGALCAVCPTEQTFLKNGLEDLRENLDTAMESIRKSVHGIRDESLDIRLELEKITSGIKERFDTDIMYDMTDEMPLKIKLGFIAILKEAVSNIARHSDGDRVQIILREHPALYQLTVYDNGSGKPKSGGMGLEDMRQRTEDMGGNFGISVNKGFTVFASVKKYDTVKETASPYPREEDR
ncbi:MAG: histidine kinase [Bacteroides sp.]|nr:histidine kinase [Bacteroides sp.]